MQVQWIEIDNFRQIANCVVKTVQDRRIVSIKVNSKLYMLYRMVTLPMTLSDPEPPQMTPFCIAIHSF